MTPKSHFEVCSGENGGNVQRSRSKLHQNCEINGKSNDANALIWMNMVLVTHDHVVYHPEVRFCVFFLPVQARGDGCSCMNSFEFFYSY